MKYVFIAIVTVLTILPVYAEELIENGDFSKGERKWDVDGKSSEIEDEEPALKIELHKREWSYVEQELEYGRDLPVALEVTVKLKTSDDFAPLEESEEYSDVDFTVGGWARWTGLVQPKADLVIRVADKGRWYYYPRALRVGDGWQTVSFTVKKIEVDEGMFTIAIPPGKGTV